MTTYSNEKERALCHVYAFVLQMMCDEFSYMAFDELCAYEYELPDDNPLTGAAIGWLYRDALSKGLYSNIDDSFSIDAGGQFVSLITELRYTVADPIFHILGEDLVGKLFLFSKSNCPQKTYAIDKMYRESDDNESKPFQTKKEFLSYCQNRDSSVFDDLPDCYADRVMHWLMAHSCACDD